MPKKIENYLNVNMQQYFIFLVYRLMIVSIISLKSKGSNNDGSVVETDRKTLMLPCDIKSLLKPILFGLRNIYLTWNYSSDQNYTP